MTDAIGQSLQAPDLKVIGEGAEQSKGFYGPCRSPHLTRCSPADGKYIRLLPIPKDASRDHKFSIGVPDAQTSHYKVSQRVLARPFSKTLCFCCEDCDGEKTRSFQKKDPIYGED